MEEEIKKDLKDIKKEVMSEEKVSEKVETKPSEKAEEIITPEKAEGLVEKLIASEAEEEQVKEIPKKISIKNVVLIGGIIVSGIISLFGIWLGIKITKGDLFKKEKVKVESLQPEATSPELSQFKGFTKIVITKEEQEVEYPYKIELKNIEEYIKIGLTKRPEIKGKEKEILAQEERIKSVKGEFFPYIDLFGSYYKVDSEFFPDKDEEFIAGIRITFPIFLGFSRLAKLGKERVILDQKKFEKINIELNVKQEIFNSYKAWQTAKENYETALAWLRSMEEDYRIIQKKYESGLASIVDVTTLLARLSQARAKVAVSKYSWIYSQYWFQKSLGMIPEIEK